MVYHRLWWPDIPIPEEPEGEHHKGDQEFSGKEREEGLGHTITGGGRRSLTLRVLMEAARHTRWSQR